MMSSSPVPSKNVSLPGVPYASSKHVQLLHSLSNKMLPIVVFSNLALRRCDDEQLKRQLEKIRDAAEQAKDILLEIRDLQASMKA